MSGVCEASGDLLGSAGVAGLFWRSSEKKRKKKKK
jgi:hypothetical protein